MVERAPEVLHRVRPPRAPLFGTRPEPGRVDGELERTGRGDDAEVAGEKRVGVAGRAHRDRRRGPRADAREREQLVVQLGAVAALVDHERPVGERGGQRPQRLGPGGGHREHGRIGVGDRRGFGETVREAAVGARERFPAGDDQASGVGARTARRHLLAEHGPQRELRRIDGAGHAPAGRLGDQRRERGVGREVGVDGDRVGVEVEQPAAPVHGGGEVAQVGEREPAANVVDERHELDDPVTVGEAQDAAVRAGLGDVLLDAGNRGRDEVREHAFDVERLTQRQPQIDAASAEPCTASSSVAAQRAGPQLGRRGGKDLLHRRVELAHAREPCGPRDRRDVEGGRLDQDARGLRPLRAGERQRPAPTSARSCRWI